MAKLTERVRFEDYLAQLVAVPTISSDPARTPDIRRGAELAAGMLREAGFVAEVVPTAGHPVVVGKLVLDPGLPAVTLYNHLDVQPADEDEWRTDPFRLTVGGDRYTGRGATDDKGPALTALMAVRRAAEARLPLNFNVIWELEEEIGSRHFEEFLRARHHDLATDSIIVSDTEWISARRPAIPYGLRGLVTFEVTLRTAEHDNHSGSVGGAARNPLGELTQIIAECYDPTSGRVHIPGFYEAVTPPSAAELENFASAGFEVRTFMRDNALHSLRTTDPREVLSRLMTEPTFEVHGLAGGYTGPGIKTAIPPAATAKLSCRLVPGQDPDKIFALIKSFIVHRHPDATIELEAAAHPYLGDLKGPHLKAAAAAVEAAFGTKPSFIREGGTIGAVTSLAEHLRAPIVMLGLSLPEHGYHAPNESFDWHQASKGMDMFEHYFRSAETIGKN